jgi:hypothetical protein
MNPLTILRDSLYFCRRNIVAIARLCLPLIMLEGVCKALLDQATGADAPPGYTIGLGLLFYPLYTAALILYLDARSNGIEPQARNLLAMALRLWPAFALLTGISTLLILLGLSMFVLPGLWVMVKMAFAEYLLVLRQYTPLAALKGSFAMTQGQFLRILACALGVLGPLWLLDGLVAMVYPEPRHLLLGIAIDSVSGFLQLFTSVVMYRLFMLLSDAEADRPRE